MCARSLSSVADGRIAVERRPAPDASPLLDSSPDPAFDRWIMIATRLLSAPVGLVTLVDGRRQFLKSAHGLAGRVADRRSTLPTHSLCRHVVESGEPLVVADARTDPRLGSNQGVTELGVVAYLGLPLRGPGGDVVGSLCVIDLQAREWSEDELAVMAQMAAGVEREIRIQADRRDHERLRHVLDGHHRVHDLIAAEAPLREVLEALVLGVESQSDGMWGSVLLYDPASGCLTHGAAPSLPAEYSAAVDGLKAGAAVGSCGSAAYLAEEVFVQDVATDPRWSPFRALAATHGVGAAWSVPILDPLGEVLGTFALYYDRPRTPTQGEVTLIRNASRLAGIAIERHRTHERLLRLATHDPLTALPNRALMTDRLGQMLAARGRAPAGVAVLFCDVDRFKLINDCLGHEAGDRVLATIASRLREVVREQDTVARFGGDEFVIAVAGLCPGGLRALADRAIRAIATPIDADASRVGQTVSVSIGIAVSTAATEPHDLIRNADTAMYQAKRAATGWAFYDTTQRAEAVDELRLLSALRGAQERDELSVVYQLVFETATGAIDGVEALLRWNHPEMGQVGPDRFIPIAEKHGLIGPIGDWVLRRAAAQAAGWNTNVTRRVSVAVNVSPRQLADPAFAHRVEAILREARLDPRVLVIEITETALMADEAAIMETLRFLDRLGVCVALDDFGTGYSSLSHLRRLPISAVKIDRSFIAGLATDRDDSAIVSGVTGMARGLGLRIVAEGVETAAQAEALRALSCDFMQGYLFARPLPAAAVTELLRAGHRMDARHAAVQVGSVQLVA